MGTPLDLIVGLGNPGPEYAATRHNAGFWFVERLADKHAGSFRKEKSFHGELATVDDGTDLGPEAGVVEQPDQDGCSAQHAEHKFHLDQQAHLLAPPGAPAQETGVTQR